MSRFVFSPIPQGHIKLRPIDYDPKELEIAARIDEKLVEAKRLSRFDSDESWQASEALLRK